MPPDPARNAEPPNPTHNTSGSSANVSGVPPDPAHIASGLSVLPGSMQSRQIQHTMPPDSAHVRCLRTMRGLRI
eukprot:8322389-Alexandrium_andersonii.AAC.1